MKFFLLLFLFLSCADIPQSNPTPSYILGDFSDDYEIEYTISDSTWIQWPVFEMNIITIDTAAMYILGYDMDDSTYTRVDYMPFENMGDFTWGYCYTAYEQAALADALSAETADRHNPKTGCNGFPFSRMKRVEVRLR